MTKLLFILLMGLVLISGCAKFIWETAEEFCVEHGFDWDDRHNYNTDVDDYFCTNNTEKDYATKIPLIRCNDEWCFEKV